MPEKLRQFPEDVLLRECKSQDSTAHDRFGYWILVADYPKDWPFPTKSLAAQEKTGETPLQANSPSLVEARLMPAKFRRFVTHMALQANYPCGQTFGKLRPDFRVIRKKGH